MSEPAFGEPGWRQTLGTTVVHKCNNCGIVTPAPELEVAQMEVERLREQIEQAETPSRVRMRYLEREVERLREAGEELATEIDDEIIRSVMIKHDSPDAVERARGAVERYRAALKASDGGATVPST